MNKIANDYFCFGIPKEAQTNALFLLATSGVLNSVSGRIKMFIESVNTEKQGQLVFDNMQQMEMTAKVEFANHDSLVRFSACGSPSQCYSYFIIQFKEVLKEYDDEIYLESHDVPTMEEFMDNVTVEKSDNDNALSLIQQQVDRWISQIGFGYFDEMTNLSNLIEETGEVARLIGREYGQQTFKPGERPSCVKTAIADELSDVLFIVVCLANQMDIDLDKAFQKNMNKKTARDKDRHENNAALNPKKESPNE